MGFIRDHFSFQGRSPGFQLLLSLVIFSFAGGILMLSLALAGMFIFDIDPALLGGLEAAESTRELMFLKYMLVCQELALFLVPALLILYLGERENASSIFRKPRYPAGSLILTLLASIALLPLTSFLGLLNSGIDLSSWFPGAAERISDRGDSIERVFGLILDGSGFWDLLLSVVIIAAIPAISEELFFRGVLQRLTTRIIRSGHAAVFVVALIFSAIHFQFDGFLPRFLLGVVFGYLYLWSGSLWLPVLAHFLNNGASVMITFYPESGEIAGGNTGTLANELQGIILPGVLLVLVLLFLRKIQAQS